MTTSKHYFSYTYSGAELDLPPTEQLSLQAALAQAGIDAASLRPEELANGMRGQGHFMASQRTIPGQELSLQYHYGKLMSALTPHQSSDVPELIQPNDAKAVQKLLDWLTPEPLLRQYLARCSRAASFMAILKRNWLQNSALPPSPQADGMRYSLPADLSLWHLAARVISFEQRIQVQEVIELPKALFLQGPDGEIVTLETVDKKPLAIIELESELQLAGSAIQHQLTHCAVSAFDELAIKIIGSRPNFKKYCLWPYQAVLQALAHSKP